MNKSEKLVFDLCQNTFLSPWSLATPQSNKPGKELCDVLVVCDPDIIIFSVKETEYKATEDYSTGAARWQKRALDGSRKQIVGAARRLARMTSVTGSDGRVLQLPELGVRRIHRVAVALGSGGELPIGTGAVGEPFVHVLEEVALAKIMNELDTVTDFVEFLRESERFHENNRSISFGLENELALYLHDDRKFPEGTNVLLITDGMWDEFTASREYASRKKAEEQSYLWDHLIEMIAADHDPSLTEMLGVQAADPVERVIRTMARESRFNRRLLADAFAEMHKSGESRARMVLSPSGVVYVFLTRPPAESREKRRGEMQMRMFVAQGLNRSAPAVIGLATEDYREGEPWSLDSGYFHIEGWTPEQEAMFESLQQAGVFRAPKITAKVVHEYPPDDSGRTADQK